MLRRKFRTLKRPFEVPMGFPGLVIMCLVPSLLLFVVMSVATKTVFVVSAFLTSLGIVLYYFLNLCKAKNWIPFKNPGDTAEDEDDDHNL